MKVLAGIDAEGGVQEVAIADRAVLVSFLHGPGSGKQKTFETTRSPEERKRLGAALRAAIS